MVSAFDNLLRFFFIINKCYNLNYKYYFITIIKMSINWHYFRAMNRKPLVVFPKATTGTIKDLYDLTGMK